MEYNQTVSKKFCNELFKFQYSLSYNSVTDISIDYENKSLITKSMILYIIAHRLVILRNNGIIIAVDINSQYIYIVSSIQYIIPDDSCNLLKGIASEKYYLYKCVFRNYQDEIFVMSGLLPHVL